MIMAKKGCLYAALAGAAGLVILVGAAVAGGGSSSAPKSDAFDVINTPSPSASAPSYSGPLTAEPVAGSSGGWSSGTYEVVSGTPGAGEVPAGRLTTAGPIEKRGYPSCYYAVLKDDAGGLDSIKANDNLAGPGTLTVKAGQFLELKGDCVWTVKA